MAYFNYHATVRRMIDEGKLRGWYFTIRHNGISPALVLLFDDFQHPVKPIREHKWNMYKDCLSTSLEVLAQHTEFN